MFDPNSTTNFEFGGVRQTIKDSSGADLKKRIKMATVVKAVVKGAIEETTGVQFWISEGASLRRFGLRG